MRGVLVDEQKVFALLDENIGVEGFAHHAPVLRGEGKLGLLDGSGIRYGGGASSGTVRTVPYKGLWEAGRAGGGGILCGGIRTRRFVGNGKFIYICRGRL